MSATIRPKHRTDAETVLAQAIAERNQAIGVDLVAQALAEAEQYGVHRALYRLAPRIANLYEAAIDMAGEVDL